MALIDILARLTNGLLMLGLPLGLALAVRRRFGGGWGLYGAGMLTFLGSQVLHLPFNAFLLNPALGALGFGERGLSGVLVLSATLLGLSSGVFEEGARYLVLRFWQRSARTWRAALMFGAGHGGIEAILVGVVALVAFFQGMAYRGADLSEILPAEQAEAAQAQLEAYWNAPWPEALLGAVERAFSLIVHLALSVMVMRAVASSNLAWLGAAVGWHALVNATAVTGFFTVSPAVTEGLIGLTAAVSLWIVLRLREPDPPPSASTPPLPPRPAPAAGRPGQAQVEESKYAG